MSIDERLDMERDDCCHESIQARLGGRLKFTGCRECGGDFGMFSATREQVRGFPPGTMERFAWYREPGNNLVLYYPCWACNFDGSRVSDDFELLTMADVIAWLDCDPMAPDHGTLAAEPEPVLASEDSRDSLELAELMDRLAGYAEECLGRSRGAWSACDDQYDNDARTARAFSARIRKDLEKTG